MISTGMTQFNIYDVNNNFLFTISHVDAGYALQEAMSRDTRAFYASKNIFVDYSFRKHNFKNEWEVSGWINGAQWQRLISFKTKAEAEEKVKELRGDK